jgi:hypothetical protein
MCCFSGPVTSVSGTKIFATMRVLLATDGERAQILAYEASVTTEASNAMVLPVPVREDVGAAGIALLDMSSVPDFFVVLFRLVEAGTPRLPTFSAPFPQPQLKVHRVGAYDVSIVPTIEDFGRLSSLFRLELSGSPVGVGVSLGQPQGLLQVFRQRYPGHSFVVCQLAPGKVDLHPFGVMFLPRYRGPSVLPDPAHPRRCAARDGPLRPSVSSPRGLGSSSRSHPLNRDRRWAQPRPEAAFSLRPDQQVELTSLRGDQPNSDLYIPVIGNCPAHLAPADRPLITAPRTAPGPALP